MGTTNSAGINFSGFIDGFQARNIAAIQKDTALQLAEMEARLAVIKAIVPQDDESTPLRTAVSKMLEDLKSSNEHIVDRLKNLGISANQTLIEHQNLMKGRREIQSQFHEFVASYLEAAEASKYPELMDLGIVLAKSFEKTSSGAVT